MRQNKHFCKRGLSLFLVLMMCLSLLPAAAYAAEDHAHNQDGWNCVWSDPERELDCTHVCGPECQGEELLNCAEAHHTEDCCDEEGFLVCEDSHEHSDECYAPARRPAPTSMTKPAGPS